MSVFQPCSASPQPTMVQATRGRSSRSSDGWLFVLNTFLIFSINTNQVYYQVCTLFLAHPSPRVDSTSPLLQLGQVGSWKSAEAWSVGTAATARITSMPSTTCKPGGNRNKCYEKLRHSMAYNQSHIGWCCMKVYIYIELGFLFWSKLQIVSSCKVILGGFHSLLYRSFDINFFFDGANFVETKRNPCSSPDQRQCACCLVAHCACPMVSKRRLCCFTYSKSLMVFVEQRLIKMTLKNHGNKMK